MLTLRLVVMADCVEKVVCGAHGPQQTPGPTAMFYDDRSTIEGLT